MFLEIPLIPSSNPLPPWLLTSAALLLTVLIALCLYLGIRAQFLPPAVGPERFVGSMAEAAGDITPKAGRVLFEGEYWNARSAQPISSGQTVRIVAVHGLHLLVEPADGGLIP